LRKLVDARLVHGLSPRWLATPPRVVARTATERAALGYLHGNCAHCHNTSTAGVPLDLSLAQPSGTAGGAANPVLASLLDRPSRFRTQEFPDATLRIARGQPETSLLLLRLRSRNPQVRMPPLGTRIADPVGLALIERWITDLEPAKESLK